MALHPRNPKYHQILRRASLEDVKESAEMYPRFNRTIVNIPMKQEETSPDKFAHVTEPNEYDNFTDWKTPFGWRDTFRDREQIGLAGGVKTKVSPVSSPESGQREMDFRRYPSYEQTMHQQKYYSPVKSPRTPSMSFPASPSVKHASLLEPSSYTHTYSSSPYISAGGAKIIILPDNMKDATVAVIPNPCSCHGKNRSPPNLPRVIHVPPLSREDYLNGNHMSGPSTVNESFSETYNKRNNSPEGIQKFHPGQELYSEMPSGMRWRESLRLSTFGGGISKYGQNQCIPLICKPGDHFGIKDLADTPSSNSSESVKDVDLSLELPLSKRIVSSLLKTQNVESILNLIGTSLCEPSSPLYIHAIETIKNVVVVLRTEYSEALSSGGSETAIMLKKLSSLMTDLLADREDVSASDLCSPTRPESIEEYEIQDDDDKVRDPSQEALEGIMAPDNNQGDFASSERHGEPLEEFQKKELLSSDQEAGLPLKKRGLRKDSRVEFLTSGCPHEPDISESEAFVNEDGNGESVTTDDVSSRDFSRKRYLQEKYKNESSLQDKLTPVDTENASEVGVNCSGDEEISCHADEQLDSDIGPLSPSELLDNDMSAEEFEEYSADCDFIDSHQKSKEGDEEKFLSGNQLCPADDIGSNRWQQTASRAEGGESTNRLALPNQESCQNNPAQIGEEIDLQVSKDDLNLKSSEDTTRAYGSEGAVDEREGAVDGKIPVANTNSLDVVLKPVSDSSMLDIVKSSSNNCSGKEGPLRNDGNSLLTPNEMCFQLSKESENSLLKSNNKEAVQNKNDKNSSQNLTDNKAKKSSPSKGIQKLKKKRKESKKDADEGVEKSKSTVSKKHESLEEIDIRKKNSTHPSKPESSTCKKKSHMEKGVKLKSGIDDKRPPMTDRQVKPSPLAVSRENSIAPEDEEVVGNADLFDKNQEVDRAEMRMEVNGEELASTEWADGSNNWERVRSFFQGPQNYPKEMKENSGNSVIVVSDKIHKNSSGKKRIHKDFIKKKDIVGKIKQVKYGEKTGKELSGKSKFLERVDKETGKSSGKPDSIKMQMSDRDEDEMQIVKARLNKKVLTLKVKKLKTTTVLSEKTQFAMEGQPKNETSGRIAAEETRCVEILQDSSETEVVVPYSSPDKKIDFRDRENQIKDTVETTVCNAEEESQKNCLPSATSEAGCKSTKEIDIDSSDSQQEVPVLSDGKETSIAGPSERLCDQAGEPEDLKVNEKIDCDESTGMSNLEKDSVHFSRNVIQDSLMQKTLDYDANREFQTAAPLHENVSQVSFKDACNASKTETEDASNSPEDQSFQETSVLVKNTPHLARGEKHKEADKPGDRSSSHPEAAAFVEDRSSQKSREPSAETDVLNPLVHWTVQNVGAQPEQEPLLADDAGTVKSNQVQFSDQSFSDSCEKQRFAEDFAVPTWSSFQNSSFVRNVNLFRETEVEIESSSGELSTPVKKDGVLSPNQTGEKKKLAFGEYMKKKKRHPSSHSSAQDGSGDKEQFRNLEVLVTPQTLPESHTKGRSSSLNMPSESSNGLEDSIYEPLPMDICTPRKEHNPKIELICPLALSKKQVVLTAESKSEPTPAAAVQKRKAIKMFHGKELILRTSKRDPWVIPLHLSEVPDKLKDPRSSVYYKQGQIELRTLKWSEEVVFSFEKEDFFREKQHSGSRVRPGQDQRLYEMARDGFEASVALHKKQQTQGHSSQTREVPDQTRVQSDSVNSGEVSPETRRQNSEEVFEAILMVQKILTSSQVGVTEECRINDGNQTPPTGSNLGQKVPVDPKTFSVEVKGCEGISRPSEEDGGKQDSNNNESSVLTNPLYGLMHLKQSLDLASTQSTDESKQTMTDNSNATSRDSDSCVKLGTAQVSLGDTKSVSQEAKKTSDINVESKRDPWKSDDWLAEMRTELHAVASSRSTKMGITSSVSKETDKTVNSCLKGAIGRSLPTDVSKPLSEMVPAVKVRKNKSTPKKASLQDKVLGDDWFALARKALSQGTKAVNPLKQGTPPSSGDEKEIVLSYKEALSVLANIKGELKKDILECPESAPEYLSLPQVNKHLEKLMDLHSAVETGLIVTETKLEKAKEKKGVHLKQVLEDHYIFLADLCILVEWICGPERYDDQQMPSLDRGCFLRAHRPKNMLTVFRWLMNRYKKDGLENLGLTYLLDRKRELYRGIGMREIAEKEFQEKTHQAERVSRKRKSSSQGAMALKKYLKERESEGSLQEDSPRINEANNIPKQSHGKDKDEVKSLEQAETAETMKESQPVENLTVEKSPVCVKLEKQEKSSCSRESRSKEKKRKSSSSKKSSKKIGDKETSYKKSLKARDDTLTDDIFNKEMPVRKESQSYEMKKGATKKPQVKSSIVVKGGKRAACDNSVKSCITSKVKQENSDVDSLSNASCQRSTECHLRVKRLKRSPCNRSQSRSRSRSLSPVSSRSLTSSDSRSRSRSPLMPPQYLSKLVSRNVAKGTLREKRLRIIEEENASILKRTKDRLPLNSDEVLVQLCDEFDFLKKNCVIAVIERDLSLAERCMDKFEMISERAHLYLDQHQKLLDINSDGQHHKQISECLYHIILETDILFGGVEVIGKFVNNRQVKDVRSALRKISKRKVAKPPYQEELRMMLSLRKDFTKSSIWQQVRFIVDTKVTFLQNKCRKNIKSESTVDRKQVPSPTEGYSYASKPVDTVPHITPLEVNPRPVPMVPDPSNPGNYVPMLPSHSTPSAYHQGPQCITPNTYQTSYGNFPVNQQYHPQGYHQVGLGYTSTYGGYQYQPYRTGQDGDYGTWPNPYGYT